MKKQLPLLLSASLIACPGLVAASPIASSLSSYYAQKSPANSSLDSFELFGLYGYFGYQQHSLELSYDSQKSDAYSNGAPTDITAVYTNYSLPHTKLKAGVRLSDIDDAVNPTNIGILGATYTKNNAYGYAKWFTGVDLFYIQSQNTTASANRSTKIFQPNSTQITPYAGYYFGVKNRPNDSILLKTSLHLQNYDKNNNTALDIESSYTTAQVALAYNTPKWSSTATLYAGESYNLVEAGGFVYNNDYNTYQSAAKLEARVGLGKTGFVSPWIKYQTVKKTTNKPNASTLTTLGLSAGFAF